MQVPLAAGNNYFIYWTFETTPHAWDGTVTSPSYLSGEDYPVLAKIWDNDDDATFDNL